MNDRLNPGDRVLVRGQWAGRVDSVNAVGDPYVRFDQGSAGVVPAAECTVISDGPAAGEGKRWPPPGLETKTAAT